MSPEQLKRDRQKAKKMEDTPQRSLETLREDYNKFLVESKGDINKAKLHNNINVIEPYMLDIPLHMVCLP